ncbi:MAG: recombinase family protein [Singulisphaera sp.]
MLDRNYDPKSPYRYARYGRMSDPKQNKRSPDQQFITIAETLRRLGYPWVGLADYRDDGISGRYLQKRAGLQKLLRDVEAGLIVIDLIVVDTYERLGRAEEIGHLRHKLFTQYGVLVVAADTNFADPTGVIGKAVGMVEQIRATENTRVSRHNVIRGKKDAARLRRWPGGPPPFGYRLKPVVDQSGAEPVVYHVLEPHPSESGPMAAAFAHAHETGKGTLRMAQWWNDHPDIPAEYKPVSPFSIGYRLGNPIYTGTLVWGANRTGVVNDTRVVEPNPEVEVLRVPDFCPPLVTAEVFAAIDGLRKRGEEVKRSRRQGGGEGRKLIAPQSRGMTLKYLLSGLVRCGLCKASARPVSSGRTSSEGRRYVYYACPRHYDGACANGRHVPEDQLRAAVIARLRARVFPAPGPDDRVPPWLPGLTALVQQELDRDRRRARPRRPTRVSPRRWAASWRAGR